jgi:hypothetical protein
LHESPESPGPACIGQKTLIARTISSRVVSCLIARPTISSELPAPRLVEERLRCVLVQRPRHRLAWRAEAHAAQRDAADLQA